MSTKHTPLPWVVEPIHEKSDAAYEVTRLCGYVITSKAPAWTHSSKHDADLIAKAVNAHDELITALRGVLRRFETEYQTLTDGEHGSIYDWSEPHRARALLAKLENNL